MQRTPSGRRICFLLGRQIFGKAVHASDERELLIVAAISLSLRFQPQVGSHDDRTPRPIFAALGVAVTFGVVEWIADAPLPDGAEGSFGHIVCADWYAYLAHVIQGFRFPLATCVV